MEQAKMPGRLLASVAQAIVSRAKSGPSRPTWSFGFEVMARTLRRTGLSIGQRPVLEQRKAWQQVAKAQPNALRREISVTDVDAGGVPAKWVVPHGVADDAPVLVYLHGGGYRYGSWESHGELVSRIARAAKVRALFVEYRLCPEHRFPAAVDDSAGGDVPEGRAGPRDRRVRAVHRAERGHGAGFDRVGFQPCSLPSCKAGSRCPSSARPCSSSPASSSHAHAATRASWAASRH